MNITHSAAFVRMPDMQTAKLCSFPPGPSMDFSLKEIKDVGFHCQKLDINLVLPCSVTSCTYNNSTLKKYNNCFLALFKNLDVDSLQQKDLSHFLGIQPSDLQSKIREAILSLQKCAISDQIANKQIKYGFCVGCSASVEEKKTYCEKCFVKRGCDKLLVSLETNHRANIENILAVCFSTLDDLKKILAILQISRKELIHLCSYTKTSFLERMKRGRVSDQTYLKEAKRLIIDGLTSVDNLKRLSSFASVSGCIRKQKTFKKLELDINLQLSKCKILRAELRHNP